MIRPLIAAAVAMATFAPAQAGDPVPPPRDIRPVEARLEPMRGFYPRADRFIPVVAYADEERWASDEAFEDEGFPDDEPALWEDVR